MTSHDAAQRTSPPGLLARENTSLPESLDALAGESRTDWSGTPAGTTAWLLAKTFTRIRRPSLIIVPTRDAMERTASDLTFCLGEQAVQQYPVLILPHSETTPFLEIAPDRGTAMDQLATLTHLASDRPWSFVIATAPAIITRLPPPDVFKAHLQTFEVSKKADRDAITKRLIDAGYTRGPVAEDPGTFAMRGALIDIFAPTHEHPIRIELSDDTVESLRIFDADTQKTKQRVERAVVGPARHILRDAQSIARAAARIREACDEINMPTTRAQHIVEDIKTGRWFYGDSALIPAYYPDMASLMDYAGDTRISFVDPAATLASIESYRERAERDFEARTADGNVSMPPADHYFDTELLDSYASRAALFHRIAVGGADDAESSLVSSDLGTIRHIESHDHIRLTQRLKQQRNKKQERPLLPFIELSNDLTEKGLKVVVCVRTDTQAKRLRDMWSAYDVSAPATIAQDMDVLDLGPQGKPSIVVGTMRNGFSLESAGLAIFTEEDLFGPRTNTSKRAKRAQRSTSKQLQDLRSLREGDLVVHVEHGIGRYLGLERKALGQTQLEKLSGEKPFEIEVLVIEYASGDRLFLPITRLNQVQRYASKDNKKTRLDKLGGQSFAKTKKRVKDHVRKMADELLALYAKRRAYERTPIPAMREDMIAFEAAFPFEETRDQSLAIDEVMEDLARPYPADRLVCGDVGFGKTEVALRAAFRVAMSGRQVVLLCPTTVLAQQHLMTFTKRMAQYPITVRVLSRFAEKKDQSSTIAGLKDGTVDIVIGTHRLLSKDVHYKNLGLLVVDEEQRFGVAHKERIKAMRETVDVITLSATPIPRTMQMAIGGLRDLSLIATAPIDRRAVRTFVSRWNDHVLREAIDRELARGGQVFFVYNRIEGLAERAQRIQALAPKARIATAHGRMREATLDRVMTSFVQGEFDILCTTAIIESGLDIPRANTIIIDRADMFGLAQLYQLRGRVGRSRDRAYCYLLTPPPNNITDEARARIETIERFTELGSGFHVASMDMELRGAGDMLGAEQTGSVSAVGFDLFMQMLEDAVAELQGKPQTSHMSTDLNVDVEVYLPEEYIEDVGLRLSLYKRLASAETHRRFSRSQEKWRIDLGRRQRPHRNSYG